MAKDTLPKDILVFCLIHACYHPCKILLCNDAWFYELFLFINPYLASSVHFVQGVAQPTLLHHSTTAAAHAMQLAAAVARDQGLALPGSAQPSQGVEAVSAAAAALMQVGSVCFITTFL